METGKIKTKLCTEGATHDQSNEDKTFDPLKLIR